MPLMKEEWPEVVGMTKEEAEAKIKAERQGCIVQFCAEGSPMTMDFNPDRVRVVHDASGKVVTKPFIG